MIFFRNIYIGSYCNLRLLSLICITAISTPGITEPLSTPKLDASFLYLFKPDSAAIKVIKPDEWTVNLKNICGNSNNINELLLSNGIYDNGDAKTIVYYYNQLSTGDSIGKTSKCLYIPTVIQGKDWIDLKDEGYRLHLMAFPADKKYLAQKTNKLYETAGIDSSDIVLLENNGSKKLSSNDVDILRNHAAFMQTVNSGNGIIPLEIIQQTIAEVSLYTNILEHRLQNNSSTQEQVSLAADLAKSFAVRADAYREVFGPLVKRRERLNVPISVRLLDKDGQPIKNKKVFYAPKALVKSEDFRRKIGLSSPAEGTIFAGYYLVWAEEQSVTGSVVISDYETVTIDQLSHEVKHITLLLTPQGNE